MKKSTVKKTLILLVATTILLGSLIFTSNAQESESQIGIKNNYFNKIYSHLNDENNVYEALTYDQLLYLLRSEGTYVILFGGAWSEGTQADIGFLNEVAKEYGITKIYNFDTKLDGQDATLDANEKPLDIADSNSQYASHYVDLVNTYLTNLQTSYNKLDGNPDHNVSYTDNNSVVHAANKIQSPFLLVYNKDHKDSNGNNTPIISYLERTNKTWNDFLTGGNIDTAKVNAYKEQVRSVFDDISTQIEGKKVANADTIDNNEYIKSNFNEYAVVTSPPIFDDSDGNVIYDKITYDELIKLLDSDGTQVILFGGFWCSNTQAAIKFINKYAKQYNIEKVYLWDTKLDGGFVASDPDADIHASNILQIRATGHPYAKLYVDFVNKYLTNINTQYDKNDGLASHNISYTDSNGNTVTASKLQVPYLLVYNKNNKDESGNSAPILGHIELMYTWANIQPDYIYKDKSGNTVLDSEGNPYVGKPYQNYTNALDTLFSRLESAPSGLTAITPTSSENNDGQITGVSNKLEYQLSGDSTWTAVTGSTITDLRPGTYKIRYAAAVGYNGPVNGTGKITSVPYSAGQYTEVTVSEYITTTEPTATRSANETEIPNDTLPQTGQDYLWAIILGSAAALLTLAGMILLVKQNKKSVR